MNVLVVEHDINCALVADPDAKCIFTAAISQPTEFSALVRQLVIFNIC